MFVVLGVVDEGEARAATATELGLETEHGDAFIVGLEFLGKFAADSFLGDVCHLGVHELNRLIGHKDGERAWSDT